MTRLGLSDSMRSTVSLEDTEPLHMATHRRPPRRPRAAAAAEPASEQQTRPKASSSMLRVLLGGLVAVILLSTGLRVLGPTRSSSNSQVGQQFDRLERNFALLGRDTARLQTTADRFLQRCQEVQAAASTRTEMLQSSATRSLNEKASTLTHEHEQVMQQVLQYYAQQEQKIRETKHRLVQMNVTLPVEVTVRLVPETWQQDQRLLGHKEDVEQDGSEWSDAVGGLALFAEKSLDRDGSDFQRLSVDSIMAHTALHLESSSRQTKEQQPKTSYGSVFFYTFVACASAVYLWSAVSDSRKELLEDKWSWSPVPKALRQLKTLLGSVVVIEDLRTPGHEGGSITSLEHIEC